MSDIDRIFARLQGGPAASGDRRELRTVPGRGVRGSRVVEVVHLRPGAPRPREEAPRKEAFSVRAASWEDGFPARQAPRLPDLPAAPAPAAAPTVHVMPAWEPSPSPESVPAAEPPATAADTVPARKPRRAGRRVADPFDPADDGANCLRCGYAIEPSRDRRGLLTCAACG